MYTHDYTRIREGMDVYDLNGDKVGSVGKVYSMTGATATTSASASSTGGAGSDWFVKIDTGFLGLGKDLYVPARAISNVHEDRLVLDVRKDAIDTFSWDEKPSFIRD
jgi:hypothetical protein